MTPVSRAYAPVAALTALLALACATRPPAASPPANGGARPHLEREQPKPSVTTAEPEPKQPELRCEELDSLPDNLDESDRREILSVLVRTAATVHDLECVQRTVARFFPLMARERPPPDDPADLPAWWRTIGYTGYYVDDDPKVLVVLPEPVPSLEPASQRRLAPLLCPQNDAACGAESRTFLVDAEEQMTELSNLTRLEQLVDDAREQPLPDPEAAIAACADEARKEQPEYAFGAWRSCVTQTVPQLVRTPSGSFRMPAQGIVTVHRFGHWDPCSEVTGFSLASGLALTKVKCTLPNLNRDVDRWRLSRVSPSGVRRVALFIALMDQMRTGPAFAEAIPIPVDIPPPPEHRGYARAISTHLSISDAPEFEYSVHGVLAEALSGRLYVYDEIEPKKRLLARLLRTSHAIGTTSCAETQDQPVLRELLTKMFPEASHLRSIEEQVAQTVSCSR